MVSLFDLVATSGFDLQGRSWSYISIHLQFAAAMAVAASGLAPDAIFEKYLYKPLGYFGCNYLELDGKKWVKRWLFMDKTLTETINCKKGTCT